MRYRALVGIKAATSPNIASKSRKEREAYHVQLMRDMLTRWDSTRPVPEYYDEFFDTDGAYASVLNNPSSAPKDVNIDDAEAVMNEVGKATGHRFYKEVPESDRKRRAERVAELDGIAAERELTEMEQEERAYCASEPTPAPRTGLYAYCVVNPDGMFKSYTYPIEHAYNEMVPHLNASRLINRNYGTPHDILAAGDLDYEGTYLPDVVFRYDGEILESGNPVDIELFLGEKLTNKDFVAIIECEV